MGLQFENLVINNFKEICRLIPVDPQDIVMSGPFFQRPTQRQPGCQIDLLIQTRHHTLYVCEIKFRAGEITRQVVDEVEEKIKNFSFPRGFSVRPVLIHVNGANQSVMESQFFDRIIDFSEFFNAQMV